MENILENNACAGTNEKIENKKIRDPIIKNGTRILIPSEKDDLIKKLNPVYVIICIVLLHTGMRVTEFWDFIHHPSWYKASRHCISLPKGAIKKAKCVYKERDIILTDEGCKAVETLLGMTGIKQVSRTAMRDALRLAATNSIGVEGVTPKMFRKTAVSWLIKCFPDKSLYIASSAGHTLETMKKDYLGIAFPKDKECTDAMKKFFEGWGE